MKFFSRLVLTALVTTFLYSSFTASAALACTDDASAYSTTGPFSKNILLSEIYPIPDSSQDLEEFIELRNTGSKAVDLAGWTLTDASGKKYVISADDFVSTELAPGKYFSVPQSTSKIYLNNGGDSVFLYQPDETLLDETEYGDAETDWSWSRISGQWEWSTTATDGKKNIGSPPNNDSAGDDSSSNASDALKDGATDESKYETSDAVLINELLPNPAGADSTDEWIELYNSGDAAVYLGGWQLTDQSRYYSLGDISINPDEYMVLEVGDTGINLNNSGDTVYLIDPFNKIVQGTDYSAAKEGESWARFDIEAATTWQWTSEITPGETNIQSAPESSASNTLTETTTTSADTDSGSELMTISAFRALENDVQATVVGVVTVLPDIFGTQYFYIQDDGSGIQVYSYRKDFPGLSVGDQVRITGKKSVTRNETRIKTASKTDIEILSSGNAITSLDVTELEEAVEGMLVNVLGEITEQSGSTATLNGLVAVALKAGANIDKNLLEEGTEIKLSGIAIQSTDEYRLQPRNNDDIELISSGGIELVPAAEAASLNQSAITTNSSGPDQEKTLLVVVIAGLLAVIAGYIMRLKNKSLLTFFSKKIPTTNSATATKADKINKRADQPTTIFDSVKTPPSKKT